MSAIVSSQLVDLHIDIWIALEHLTIALHNVLYVHL